MDITTGEHMTPHPPPEEEVEFDTSTGLPNLKVAMWIFLGSECLLFGALITTYVLYRGRSTVGPYPHDLFDIGYTSVSSFVLLASSLTMVLALAAIQRNDHRRFRVWILATALFGMAFIGGQVYEFTEFYREGVHPGTNLFGTTFYPLVGASRILHARCASTTSLDKPHLRSVGLSGPGCGTGLSASFDSMVSACRFPSL